MIKSIELQILGEYGYGGKFMSDSDMREKENTLLPQKGTKENTDSVEKTDFRSLYRGEIRGPIEGITERNYEELALEKIRLEYPEATFDCFSGCYGLGYSNSLTNSEFINYAGAWEYPGTWYAGPMSISNDRFVELLVEDGLLCLQNKRGKFNSKKYDF